MRKKIIGILVCILFLLPTYTTIVDAGFNTNIFTNSYIIYDKEIDKGISFLCLLGALFPSMFLF